MHSYFPLGKLESTGQPYMPKCVNVCAKFVVNSLLGEYTLEYYEYSADHL